MQPRYYQAMAYATKRIHTNVAFTPELHERAVTVAKAKGLSLGEWIRRLIEVAVRREEAKQ